MESPVFLLLSIQQAIAGSDCDRRARRTYFRDSIRVRQPAKRWNVLLLYSIGVTAKEHSRL